MKFSLCPIKMTCLILPLRLKIKQVRLFIVANRGMSFKAANIATRISTRVLFQSFEDAKVHSGSKVPVLADQ